MEDFDRARLESRNQMSRRATSFYYSFLVLPAGKRDAIVAVWDFCRAVDDAVDEAPPLELLEPLDNDRDGDAARALAHWREELARLYDGREPLTPQGRALQPVLQRFPLP